LIRKYIFLRDYLLFLFIILLSPGAYAIEAVDSNPTGFENNNFAGGRFGAWVMTSNEDFLDSLTDFTSSALYAEFFYAHRIAPFLSIEVSVGIFSQGDMAYDTDAGTTIGAAKIYPFFISGKMYPLNNLGNSSLYPYLRLGGGIVHGTRDYNTIYYNDPANYYLEESETKITYLLGAGIDWPIADQIGLNIDFKYAPVKFSNALAGLKDYSGWNLTFGVGYIFKSK
jgi:opacity protein-like surface antigen